MGSGFPWARLLPSRAILGDTSPLCTHTGLPLPPAPRQHGKGWELGLLDLLPGCALALLIYNEPPVRESQEAATAGLHPEAARRESWDFTVKWNNYRLESPICLFISMVFLRQGLALYPWLARHSLYSLAWP